MRNSYFIKFAKEKQSNMLQYRIFVYLNSIMLLCSAYNNSQTPATGIWETTTEPGNLLQKLDLYTGNIQFIDLPVLQRRAGYAANEEISAKPYDYERAYDEFVQQYFAKAANDDESAESEAADAYSAEDLSSYEATAASKARGKIQCKRVYKKQQSCEICKNPRNGETTEDCAYIRQSKPQHYAYENQKNYEIHRTKSIEQQSEETEADDSAADFNIDDSKSEESIELKNMDRNAQLYAAAMLAKANGSNKQKQQQLPRSVDNDKTSSCIKKPQRNKICFYCKNTNGEKLVKCYAGTFTATALPADTTTASAGNEQSHEIGRNLKKSQQRIYKRTVSYTYEKTARDRKNYADNKNDTNTSNTSSSEELPGFRRKVLIKIIKRKHLPQN